MWLLLHRQFSFETTLTPAEVLDRLQGAVEEKKWFRSGRTPFEGMIIRNEFEVTPIIRGRNSFLPTISGIVEPKPDGARVSGTMKAHPLAIAFMIVWLAFVGTGCLHFVGGPSRREPSSSGSSQPFSWSCSE